MLILSRRREESIVIGDDIRIKVLAVKGERVHLGIDAPSHVSVHREEIYDMIRDENIRASRLSLESFRPNRRRTG